MNIKRSAVAASLAMAGLWSAASHPVQAQEAAVEGQARLVVDLRDATLDDALNMIFKAVGNPTHSIDPAAKTFNIGTYHNQEPKAWNDIVRTLANMGNFSMRRDPGDGSWRIELRAAPTTAPGFSSGLPDGGINGMPSNITTFGNRTMSSVRVSPQIAPRRRTGTATSGGTFQIIPTEHVYAGAIALLFVGGDVLPTLDFVLPASAFNVGTTGGSQGTTGGTGGLGGTGGGIGGGAGGGIGGGR